MRFSVGRSTRDLASTVPLSRERKAVLLKFQRSLGVHFSDISLLNLALVHKSYTNEHKFLRLNNERLEFLGDSVLGLVITGCLYHLRADAPEGYLAKCKAHIVSEKILTEIAQTIAISSVILIGRGEERSGGRQKSTILSDTLEAIIGAYYLDSGFKQADAFVLRIFKPEIDKVLRDEHSKDYKTILQEYVQQRFKSYPVYTVARRSGPEHKQVFWVTVEVQGNRHGPASGMNKKDAEQAVARVAYGYLTDPHRGEKSAASRSKKAGGGSGVRSREWSEE